ncbi:MAG: hypothetical protein J0J06_04465 [Sphingomonas sp.]|uniref:surface-adhesin E family protein n=1 Tax=Sphingomonas sp. TaxID=28214 RepID=UPI001ACDB892|nr:surface-adhesin E family protein [Sphingomonas sp.]MBN8814685.1 hypothetical protein [Sphingomonas sp.]
MLKWLALAATLWAMPASAKNWYLVATSESRTTAYFIDRDSIVTTSTSLRRVTAWSVHSTDDSDGTASRELVLEFDCANPRYRFLHLTSYTASLTVVADDVGSGTWRTVSSGSLDDSARQFACSGGIRPTSAKNYGAGNPFKAGRAALSDGSSSSSGSNAYSGGTNKH